MSLPVLPTFSSQTKVILCEDDNYVQHAYQYGTTSHIDETMKPAAIIYPKNVDDIIKAVNYARENDLGIAVITGGHQYSGWSFKFKLFHIPKYVIVNLRGLLDLWRKYPGRPERHL